MQTFPTIQELLLYCKYCPLCHTERDISISIGPDYYLQLSKFEWENSCLILNASYKPFLDNDFYINGIGKDEEFINLQVDIDCKTNSFSLSHDVGEEDFDLYFYVHAICAKCFSSSNSTDIIRKSGVNEFFDIGIEQEMYFAIKEDDKFAVSYIRESLI